MRKGSAVVVAVAVIFGLGACGGDGDNSNAESDATATPEVEAVTVESPTPTSTPLLVATPTPTGQYTVLAGDTLGAIAKRFGVSLDDIVAANDIDDPDTIRVGQVLQIPTPSASSGG